MVGLALLAIALSPIRPAFGACPGKNGEVVFVKSHRLWVIQPDGSGLHRLAATPAAEEADPAWSPDGKRLAFDVGLDVYVANADGSNPVDITTRPLGSGGCDSDPTWSPDGAWIAVSAVVDNCTGAANEIDAMTPTGSDRHVIEQDYEGLLGGDTEPAWGPGGSRIAITRSDSLRMASGPYVHDLYLLNAKTGKVSLRLTRDGHSTSASFSPDGQQIVFVDKNTVTVRTAAGTLIRLAPGSRPAWSPDGKQIVYVAQGGLHVMSPNCSKNHLLLKCSCASPNWQPLH